VLRDLFLGLIDLIYPACCILCKITLTPVEKPHRLCFACQNKLKKNHPPFCRKCSRPLENPKHAFCLTCQEVALKFENAWGTFLYNETMQKLLHLFKYGHKSSLRFFFVDHMTAFIREYHIDLSEIDLIVPIPLHPTRRRERGYNQSQILAEMLSQDLKIPILAENLIRIRHTPNQARLTQKERWTNLEAAFKINNSNRFRDKSILLIDDLYTTGATVSQVSGLLKTAGAREVKVLTLAIAVSEKDSYAHP
jgi:ComF family protein